MKPIPFFFVNNKTVPRQKKTVKKQRIYTKPPLPKLKNIKKQQHNLTKSKNSSTTSTMTKKTLKKHHKSPQKKKQTTITTTTTTIQQSPTRKKKLSQTTLSSTLSSTSLSSLPSLPKHMTIKSPLYLDNGNMLPYDDDYGKIRIKKFYKQTRPNDPYNIYEGGEGCKTL